MKARLSFAKYCSVLKFSNSQARFNTQSTTLSSNLSSVSPSTRMMMPTTFAASTLYHQQPTQKTSIMTLSMAALSLHFAISATTTPARYSSISAAHVRITGHYRSVPATEFNRARSTVSPTDSKGLVPRHPIVSNCTLNSRTGAKSMKRGRLRHNSPGLRLGVLG